MLPLCKLNISSEILPKKFLYLLIYYTIILRGKLISITGGVLKTVLLIFNKMGYGVVYIKYVCNTFIECVIRLIFWLYQTTRLIRLTIEITNSSTIDKPETNSSS